MKQLLIYTHGSELLQYCRTVPNTAVVYCGILTLEKVELKLPR